MQGVFVFLEEKNMITKEEIRKKLEEDPNWTPSDDATDADWDLYFEVKDEMSGGSSPDISWEDDEGGDEEPF